MGYFYSKGLKYTGISDKLPEDLKYFSDKVLSYIITIPKDYLEIDEVLSVIAESTAKEIHLVNTSNNVSFEGRVLAGRKIIVTTVTSIKLKYKAEKLNTINSLNKLKIIRTIPIIVPEKINGENIENLIRREKYSTCIYIEDILLCKISKTQLRLNISLISDLKFYNTN